MASIHKDPRGYSKYWFACFRTKDGKRRMVSTRETDKKKAQTICDAWQAAENLAASGNATEDQIRDILNQTLRSVGLRDISVPRVEQVFNDFLKSKELTKVTHAGYVQAFNEFFDFMGQRRTAPLESITEVDIDQFTKHLQKTGRTNATINKIVRSYLSAPFAKALKFGKIRFNPVLACDALPTDSSIKDTFTAQDAVRLIEAAPTADWAGAITLAYCSGMRLMDIANFEWEGVDLENDLLSFTERKTKNPACLGLHPDFKDWLLEHASVENQKFVFPTLAGKAGSGRSGLSRQFANIMTKAGLVGRTLKTGTGKGRNQSSLGFHSFRHSAVSAVYNKSAAEDIARRVSQHKGDVIKKYVHPDAANLKAAVNLIPRLHE
jgi:integrase